jgi:hypothetical protein
MSTRKQEGLTLIATCDQVPEAHICRSLLQESGIPCFIENEHHDRELHHLAGQGLEIGLLVPFSMHEQAIAILESTPDPSALEEEALSYAVS